MCTCKIFNVIFFRTFKKFLLKKHSFSFIFLFFIVSLSQFSSTFTVTPPTLLLGFLPLLLLPAISIIFLLPFPSFSNTGIIWGGFSCSLSGFFFFFPCVHSKLDYTPRFTTVLACKQTRDLFFSIDKQIVKLWR